MRNVVKSSPFLTILALLIAYPWVFLLVPIIVIGLVKDVGGTVLATALVGSAIVGCLIAVPGPTRFLFAIQRAWAKKVFEVWKLIEMKRTVKQTETRMRETIVSEARPVQDLGDDLDAS
ncbi:MAG: hypothetical protein L0G69_12155 [Brevibacterium sp.]|nr:hypothetical protein [Brevibacterium sp.]